LRILSSPLPVFFQFDFVACGFEKENFARLHAVPRMSPYPGQWKGRKAIPQVLSFFLWGTFLSFFPFDFDRMRMRAEEDIVGAKGKQKKGKWEIRSVRQVLIDGQLTRPSYYRGTLSLSDLYS